MIHPIIDEYYNHSPSYSRNLEFACDKGLVSSGVLSAPLAEPQQMVMTATDEENSS